MKYSIGRKIYIGISAILVLTVLVTIFYLSAQNGTESSETSGFFTKLIEIIIGKSANEAIIRMLAHFCEFAGLGFLVHNLLFSVKNKMRPLLSVILSFGYAFTDEIHQIFVPGRAFQLIDLIVDFGGIVLGVLLFFIFLRIIDYTKTKKNL